MKQLTKEQQENLTLAIQAGLGILIIGMSTVNAAKIQTDQQTKLARKTARELAASKKQEYRLKKKLDRQKYLSKIQQEKLRRAAKQKLYAPLLNSVSVFKALR